jgi:2-polyprenyl-6-methoxyphenol hydroxylase-like FAD-dependent oxidoreductase
MGARSGERAIVIGGSMCGLMAGRVLAEHYEQVVVLEKDEIEDAPVLHKSVPQGHHYHALLLGGLRTLESLFPGFADDLAAAGAVPVRPVVDQAFYFPAGKAYSPNGRLREPRDLGFDIFSQSRGLVEHCVRRRASAVENLELRAGVTAERVVHEGERTTGVVCRDGGGPPETLAADLVIDCSGRASRVPRWLEEMGLPAPGSDEVGVDFAYASARFRIPEDREREPLMFFLGPPPDWPNAAIVGEIEGGLAHVSLAGRFGDYPPGDEEGFHAFVARLPSPRLGELLNGAERVSDIVRYRFPTSLQRRYDRLERHAVGLLAVGDAVCSFNPIYGQGMSSAALQVGALGRLLGEVAASDLAAEQLAARFYAEAEAVVRTPWTFATSQDLQYPQTVGERSPELQKRAAYVGAVGMLAVEDPEVHGTFVEVAHLARPFSALEAEPLRSRALARLAEMKAAGG